MAGPLQVTSRRKELLKRRELRANTAAALTTLQLADDASRLRTQALAHATEVGLTQDVAATRQAIASRGKSFFRFLSGEYRALLLYSTRCRRRSMRRPMRTA